MISRKERTAVPEELARLRQIASELKWIEYQLAQIESSLGILGAVRYDKEPIMGGIKHDHSDTIAKLLDIRSKYAAKWDELIGIRNEVITKIESLPKQEHRLILSNRYVCNLSWQDIMANHLHYSWGHVKRLHRDALKEYSKILKNEP